MPFLFIRILGTPAVIVAITMIVALDKYGDKRK